MLQNTARKRPFFRAVFFSLLFCRESGAVCPVLLQISLPPGLWADAGEILLRSVSITEQTGCTDRWEALENLIGRDGFNEVFTHTRTIFAQERPKKSLLDAFREFVVNRTTPKGLIDDILTPYTKAYFAAKKGRTFRFCPFLLRVGKIMPECTWLLLLHRYSRCRCRL